MKRVILASMKNFTYTRYKKFENGLLKYLESSLKGEIWDDNGQEICVAFPSSGLSIGKIRTAIQEYAINQGYSAWFMTSSGGHAKSITSDICVEIKDSDSIPYVQITVLKDMNNSEKGKIFIDIQCQYVE